MIELLCDTKLCYSKSSNYSQFIWMNFRSCLSFNFTLQQRIITQTYNAIFRTIFLWTFSFLNIICISCKLLLIAGMYQECIVKKTIEKVDFSAIYSPPWKLFSFQKHKTPEMFEGNKELYSFGTSKRNTKIRTLKTINENWTFGKDQTSVTGLRIMPLNVFNLLTLTM